MGIATSAVQADQPVVPYLMCHLFQGAHLLCWATQQQSLNSFYRVFSKWKPIFSCYLFKPCVASCCLLAYQWSFLWEICCRGTVKRKHVSEFHRWRILEVSCSGWSVDRRGSTDALLMRLHSVWERQSVFTLMCVLCTDLTASTTSRRCEWVTVLVYLFTTACCWGFLSLFTLQQGHVIISHSSYSAQTHTKRLKPYSKGTGVAG